MDETKEIKYDDFFKSETHKYLFALLYTDKKLRMKLLDISEELYENENAAKSWRNKILKLIHPDNCELEGAKEAIEKLNELYARMTERDE